jgi:hypothetical protein
MAAILYYITPIIFGIAGLLGIWKLFAAKGGWKIISIGAILLAVNFLIPLIAAPNDWITYIILWVAGVCFIIGFILAK